MAWNEPGNGKNPWQGKNQGPPDLDELVKRLQQRISSIFGGGKGGADGGSGIAVVLILFGIAVLWALAGLYKVDAAERGVVLRFGEYNRTAPPGLRWHMRIAEDVEIVNIDAVQSYDYNNQMLTADENFVAIELTVQYRRSDPKAYLFNVLDADSTLNDVSESAVREIVGKSTAEEVLTTRRNELVIEATQLMQQILDQYESGIEVTSVNLKKAQLPPQIQDAVADATRAREDEERLRLEAQAYARDIVPRARGEAARRLLEAEAYRDGTIANAEGEASRFAQLLFEYEKAPEVTRQRIYIETIEAVFRDSNKVILDSEGSGNLLYLPIDKLMEQRGVTSGSRPATSSTSSTASSSQESQRGNDDRRSSGSR